MQDADDQNPAFFYERYDALLPEGGAEGQKLLVQPQDLRAFDKDLGRRRTDGNQRENDWTVFLIHKLGHSGFLE